MATQSDLMAAGFANLQASMLGFSQQEAQTAAGSSRTDAFAITRAITQFTTVGSSTGAVLPATTTVGKPLYQRFMYVKNDGAQTLKLYASGSDTISGTAGSDGVDVPAAEGYLVMMLLAGGGWIGFPLGT